MDNIENSMNNNTNNLIYQNKLTNFNFDNFNITSEVKLNPQLDILKEKIRLREAELIEMMKNQKEHYEKMSQDRDSEVTNLVEQIVTENQDLKKHVLNLEIEKEYYKETLNEYKKNNEYLFFEEDNSQNMSNVDNSQIHGNRGYVPTDRLFFQSVKCMNELFENKQRELNEKYDILYYNFLKEKSEEINKIKSLDFSELIYNIKNSKYNEEHVIPFELFEQQFLIYENKVKLLFDELKNKESQTLISENKFDLLTEENRAIKRKFNEEKKFLLVKINEIKLEHEKIHKQVINKLEEEIREKKITLEKRVAETVKINEDIIQSLLKEKNEISENFREVEKKLWVATQELEFSEKERKSLEEFMERTQIEMNQKKDELNYLESENKKLKLENELFEKAKDDLSDKLNEANFRKNALDSENKILSEKLSLKIKENEKLLKDNEYNLKNQTERLNVQILESGRKVEDFMLDNEKYMENIKILERKIVSENEIIDMQNQDLEKLKLEINEIKLNNKNLMISLEEKTFNLEKSRIISKQLEKDIVKKDENIKNLRETLTKFDSEKNHILFEIEKLTKIKKDLSDENEEHVKSRSLIMTQMDSLKISYNLELQKLRTEISELEKKNQNKTDVSIELANINLKKEIYELRRGLYQLFYKYIANKDGIQNLPNPLPKLDENKIFADLDNLLDKNSDAMTEKLFDNITYTSANNSQFNHIIPNSNINNLKNNTTNLNMNPNNENVIQKEKEIKLLNEENMKLKLELTKLNELNLQLKEVKKENINISSASKSPNENPYFKNAEKEVINSLYESLIVYLKNLQLVNLMEVYQLNLQREEDIRKILETKNIPNIEEIRKQFLKLNDNFNIFKNHVENTLKEYYIRSKSYVSYDEFENKILEHKNFTENILNVVLGKFFEKKDARKDYILFKFEHTEYNQIIEDLTNDLESFHTKEFSILENLKKNLSNIEPAIEVLAKQTVLESDKLYNFLNNPNYKLI